MDSAYDLYTRGMRLLEDGDHHAAAVPLQQVRDLEPDKTSSARPSAGRCSAPRRFREAEAEFLAVVERAPTNHYALFCLGRVPAGQGRHAEAGSRWPWRPACARTARTTASTATARAATPLKARLKPPSAAP